MDRRDANIVPWYEKLEEKTMTAQTMLLDLTVPEEDRGYVEELVDVPFKYETCPLCRGRGKHVNPDIDRQGITQEDFDQDPDFEESYHRGDYDVPCNECEGLRVVAVVDESRCTPELAKRVKDKLEEIRTTAFDECRAMEMGY